MPPAELAGRRPDCQAARRAARLLRWYPPSWRARYGEEFAELLLADLAEQPRSCRRGADIAVSGLLARCTAVGLTSHRLPPAEQIRYGVATLCCALAGFLALGVAMLAQLATGWQWLSPHSAPVATGTVVMALAVGCLVLAVIAAAAPLVWHAVVALVRLRDGRLVWPAVLASSCGSHADPGGPALRERLAWNGRHRRGARPGTGRAGCLRLGVDSVGLVVLGAPNQCSAASRLPS